MKRADGWRSALSCRSYGSCNSSVYNIYGVGWRTRFTSDGWRPMGLMRRSYCQDRTGPLAKSVLATKFTNLGYSRPTYTVVNRSSGFQVKIDLPNNTSFTSNPGHATQKLAEYEAAQIALENTGPLHQYSITEEVIQGLPQLEFKGKITVTQDAAKVDDLLAHMFRYSELGIDTEATPTIIHRSPSPLALLQISSPEHAVLLRLNRMKTFPRRLKELLEEDRILKVGVGLTSDVKSMLKLFRGAALFPDEKDKALLESIGARGMLDLKYCAHGMRAQPTSLRSLTGMFLGARLSKKEQMSNWELPLLTHSQIQYAACDAWAGLMVFDKMRQLNGEAIEHTVRTRQFSVDPKMMEQREGVATPPSPTNVNTPPESKDK